MTYCDRCGIYGSHALSCPTKLVTHEQRVALAAHLLQCFDPPIGERCCRQAGLNHTEIAEGRIQAEREKREYERQRAWMGDPAYGGWVQ